MTSLPPDKLRWLGVRFLDPSGRVFEFEGEFYRAIYPDKVAHVRKLFDSGIVARLVERGLLIPTEITPLELSGYGLVLHHRRVPFTIRGGDWPRSLLRDAGRVVLELNLELLRDGFCTLDAHSANIGQIDCCRPVWLDLGSIATVPKRNTGLAEFRRCYTNPLRLLARSPQLGRLARTLISDGGVSDEEMSALAGVVGFLAKAQRHPRVAKLLKRAKDALPREADGIKAREQLLRAELEKIDVTFPPLSTQWGGYHQSAALPASYDDQTSTRRQTILRLLRELKPRRVLDLACNEGFFSFMAARQGCEVLAVDYDEGAVESLYTTARQCREPLQVTAACYDLLKPRRAIPQGELVFALALTHHLSITQQFPFSHIAALLAGYTTDALITEFMPNGVGGHTPKPDPLPAWYTLENYMEAFRPHFASVERVEYPIDPTVSPRVMILCRGRKAA